MTLRHFRRRGLLAVSACTSLLLLTACGKQEPIEFNFSRISATGESYNGTAMFGGDPWACVLDERTSLIWEVKSAQPGLHYAGNTYSWHYPPEAEVYTRGDEGQPNAGQCTDSDCDTWSFTKAVNERGLCGYHDWRVPTREELGSIVDPRIKPPGPTLNTDYFPNTVAAEHWSSSAYAYHSPGAWTWEFLNGLDRVDLKGNAKHIRLVRGEAGVKPEPPRGPKR
jgi:hypothetical protein